jgi:hypothetical protein
MSRGLDQTRSIIIVIIVLVVIAAACAIILIVILVSNWRMKRRTEPARPVSHLSEKSFSSPDAKILTTDSAPIPRRKSKFSWDCNSQPLRPERPVQPWGEDISSERAPSTRVPLKRRLSATLVKAFSMRRPRFNNAHSQPSPQTEQSVIPPTVRAVATPKKAFAHNRAWSVSLAGVGSSRSSCEDRHEYLPLPSRAPSIKLYPTPLSFRKRPDEDSILPL